MDEDRWRGDYRDYDASEFHDVTFQCPVPECKASTVLRYADQGPYKHKPFYGCANYPHCQSITCVDGTVRRPVNPDQEAENRRALLSAAEGQRGQLELIKTLVPDHTVPHPDSGRGGTMLSGLCSQCGASVRLNADGSCIHGHPRDRVSQIVDHVDDLFEPIIWSRQSQSLNAALGALIDKSSPLNQEVTSASRRLQKAEKFGTACIAGGLALCLYENGINGNHKTNHFNFETYCVKATLARYGSGNGKAIVVESDALNLFGHPDRMVIEIDSNEHSQARRLVDLITATAAGAPTRAQQRVQMVAAAQKEFDDLVIRRAALLAEDRGALAAAVQETVATGGQS